MVPLMKRSLLLLMLSYHLAGHSQETFVKISESYFRSTPFHKEFSRFVSHLMNDPTLINKRILKKTDSTLFFLEGDYSSHNPFFFKSIRTSVILAEKELETGDSLRPAQTIYIYQLIGYAPSGEDGIKEVKAEYEKFCRRYKKGFSESAYKELKEGDKQSGEMNNFSFNGLSFYPLTAAWATSKTHQDNLFAITIRFKVFNNTAYLFPQLPRILVDESNRSF
jgi:hypothetical protein